MNDQKGFTLIEVLIVAGVILVIGIFSALAVNSARSKSRDAVRLSQVRMLQSALEDFYNENNGYPRDQGIPLGDATQSACLGAAGFQADCSTDRAVLLRAVMGTVESGLKDQVICGTPARNAFCYSQLLDASTYRIQFELENNWNQVGLIQGINCAYPDGIEAGRCRLEI
ncbi:type II secretion system GspH family protein [Patescibacteria group bacterium]|nr:type II secretion system GspH family protein [Patescibacteria group bacterium]MBU1705188.1 type II secretion system GspH family protein [Patescibacteria group bacterium]